MTETGRKKAALLLLSLDPSTAAELLKSARTETVTAIAAELAWLKAVGQMPKGAGAATVREFFGLLAAPRRRSGGGGGGDFLSRMLENAVGKDKSREILSQVHRIVQERDPFLAVRSAPVEQIAQALHGESAQVACLVLSELPTRQSTKLLALLDEQTRRQAVRAMTAPIQVPPETRRQVAMAVVSRLEKKDSRPAAAGAPAAATAPSARQADATQPLRKLALLLRGLDASLREAMLAAVADKDAQTGQEVRNLMVIWEDLPVVDDRACQQALRTVDARTLAMACWKNAPAVTTKIRANISERVRAMLEEEASLLTRAKTEDVAAAREKILQPLRELNERGELTIQGG